jgi:hypothetical protein
MGKTRKISTSKGSLHKRVDNIEAALRVAMSMMEQEMELLKLVYNDNLRRQEKFNSLLIDKLEITDEEISAAASGEDHTPPEPSVDEDPASTE